jgi:hypothetical protein
LPLASFPSGLPRNPNVLLIRTHPNPSPSVANTNAIYQQRVALKLTTMYCTIPVKINMFSFEII